jgi:hypothetical protein
MMFVLSDKGLEGRYYDVLSGEVNCGHFARDMKSHPFQRARLKMSVKLATIVCWPN